MTIIKPQSTIGIIGGGQLGRMSALAAAALGLRVHIYSDHEDSPAAHVSNSVTVAAFDDIEALKRFASSVDVVTFEFENIPDESIKAIESVAEVRPGSNVLKASRNRVREKDFLNNIGVKTAPYKKIESFADLQNGVSEIGPKCILKTAELGYDGKGQYRINPETQLDEIWSQVQGQDTVLEGMVDFEKEISVIIARGKDGVDLPFYPSENIHKNGILDVTIAPARIEDEIVDKAWNIARSVVSSLDLVGILAVEMFLMKNGDLLVNEIAPRPHNSGHWTMDACITSQFEQFIRAVCGMPLGSAEHQCRSVMKNLIGSDIDLWDKYVAQPSTKIHLYGKKVVKEGRKMGHVTHLLLSDDDILEDIIDQ
ncbi:5-(carboxyamino)imidazole ribonucleotide synthase [Rickettsiales bacterium]|nr:5-(carboxyamino)imidazole ribonucleotide synthase [Rickettsiales bacterium]